MVSISEIQKQEGAFKKFLKALKKLISKEFLWIVCILVISVPFALLVKHLMIKYIDHTALTELIKQLGTKTEFLTAYALCFAGFYFSRMVLGSIKSLVNKK